MPTETWVTVTAAEAKAILSRAVLSATNENTGVENPPGVVDEDQDTRLSELIGLLVEEFRGAIRYGGRTRLDPDEAKVPPDVKRHILNMAVFQTVNGTPTLQMVLMNEGAVYAPLRELYNDGKEELKRLTGGGVTADTDEDVVADEENGVPAHGGGGDLSEDSDYSMVTEV